MDLYEIGAAIRRERHNRKMTQEQLAKRAGVSRTTIWQVETGKLDDLGIRKLIRIAEALGLGLRLETLMDAPPTLDDLLRGDR